MSRTHKPPPLRSVFEPGTTRWAVRRAQWLAMGLSEADFHKPKIAVVNSSSKLSVCFAHLDDVAATVCEAVREAGAVPFEIRTVAPSDFVTSAGKQGRYLMPSRDLLVNDIEVQVEGAELDGMILLASCDKTTPGQLMAAARLNIPSIVVPCGYQIGGQCGGRGVDIEDVYKAVGTVKAGRMGEDVLTDWTRHAIVGPGVCAGLGTANSMHIMAEALGMTLPGAAPVRAGSERMWAMARAAGEAIVALLQAGVRPRDVMTQTAFRNAVRVACAVGVSVNCVRHLTAVAAEGEVDVDVIETFRTVGEETPLLCTVRPNGPERIEALEVAGGARAVMAALAPVMEDAPTVAGSSMLARLDGIAPPTGVIRPLSSPARGEPGLVLLRGSLAPIGCIVKLAGVPSDVRRFEGPARVFEDERQAIDALGNGSVRPGDVVVLRMLGPIGGPGTVFAASFMAALVGAGLGDDVAVVTDGELSGLNRGITVGQVMPEAAEGGPLALVEEDDTIAIHINERRIDLLVDETVIAARQTAWSPPPPTEERGWLAQYGSLVRPLAEGAVLRAKRP
ncbi:MAG: dihydroxy-acid dehydratase [Pseudomonadota bacterium]